jgi:hypothetical protein
MLTQLVRSEMLSILPGQENHSRWVRRVLKAPKERVAF